MKGAAPYIDAATSSLKAGLAARVTAFNAEPNNPQLTDVADTSIFFGGSEKIQAGEYPAIEIAAPQTVYALPSLRQVDFELGPSLVVVVWTQNPERDMPTLYRMSLGYERCCLEVLCQPDAFGGGVAIKTIRCFRPRPNPETRQFEYLTMAGVLAFELDDEDARPAS